jgi:hypothetical protein
MSRYHCDEQLALADLLADRPVPDVSAAQLALVEPDFDAGGSQRRTNPSCRLGVLRRITEKYGPRRLSHRETNLIGEMKDF